MEDNRNNERRVTSDRRRSIRDISLSEEIQGKRRTARPTRQGGSGKSYYKRGSGAARYGIGIILVALVLFGGIFVVSSLSRATITITPRSQNVVVDKEITISESGTAGTPLSYEIFSLEETLAKAVEGGEERRVERSAQGRITIFNNDTRDQALINRTRFESESGKIYRIPNSNIIVPAAKGGTPGKLVVTVTADEVGEDSNLASGRLTIPGLEGMELFNQMYGEVETPIEGGFVGNERTVSDADERQAREEIVNMLTESLDKKVASSLPAEYVLIPESVFFEFSELPNETQGDSISVRTKGTVYGLILRKDILAGYLANEYLEDYDNSPIEIKNLENLNIELDEEELSLESIQNEITLGISGNVDLVWRVDEEEVRELVSGADEKQMRTLSSSIPGASGIHLKLTPSFLRSVPTNPEKIDVVISDGL